MTGPRPRIIAAAIAVLALGIGAPVAAMATVPTGVDDFTFESFSGEYHLGVDGSGRATTRVVETIVALFPEINQNRGIIRAIPTSDQEIPLELTMVSVTDENGTAVPYERSDYGGFAEFALGTDDYVHGRTTYVLEYTLANTIRHFSDSGGDEFYWDINGTGWRQSFGSVSATVVVPQELAASLTGEASCYQGTEGSVGTCTLTRSGDGDVEFSTTVSPVGAYVNVTVAIGFEGNTVVAGQAPRDSWIVTIAPKVLVGISALLVAFAAFVRNAIWRDARGRGTIIAQYQPPEGSNLLLDANIIGRVPSGLPALFVDLAVRGLIKVIDTDPTGERNSKLRFSIELVTPDGATAAELRVLVMLFGVSLSPGKEVKPGMLSASIGASLAGLPAFTAATAVKEGYRADPPKSLIRTVFARVGLATLLAYIPIVVWAAIHDVFDDNVFFPILGSIALAITWPLVLGKPQRLTEKGAEARDYLLGMKQYLTIAEAERIRVLQSPQGAERVDVTDTDAVVKLNERLLGYAVLWGVEDEWVEQLRAHYPDSTPAWFEGDSFSPSVFRSFTHASTSSVRPIVTSSSSSGSSWSSSGGSSFSSGSSGGGFSGGGGGGGGGGGR